MSIVKVDLRSLGNNPTYIAGSSSQSSSSSSMKAAATSSSVTATTSQTSSQSSNITQTLPTSPLATFNPVTAAAAPLVKISLTPEGNRTSEHSFSSGTSTSAFFNSVPESTLLTTSSSPQHPLQPFIASTPITTNGLTTSVPTTSASATTTQQSCRSPQLTSSQGSRSNGSLSNRIAPVFQSSQISTLQQQQQHIGSTASISSSPSGTPLLRSLCNGNAPAAIAATTTTTITSASMIPQQSQQNYMQQISPLKQISPASRFELTKNRKVSSNWTEEIVETHFSSSNLSPQQQQSQQQQQSHIQQSQQSSQATMNTLNGSQNLTQINTLNRRLEQSQLENSDLREKLAKEKQQSQLIISENLQMKEALLKAQKKLKQYEQLHSMRVPPQQQQQQQSQQLQQQYQLQRGSLFVQRQQKKSPHMPSTTREIEANHNLEDIDSNNIHNTNPNRCTNQQQQNQSVSGDFSSCDQQHVIESTTHFNNRLSNHSILDILQDLRPENKDAAAAANGGNGLNRSFYASDHQAQRRAQLKQANKSICTAQQAKRRSEITPKSFTRFDQQTTTSTVKKSFI